jgi:hypothetical protein
MEFDFGGELRAVTTEELRAMGLDKPISEEPWFKSLVFPPGDPDALWQIIPPRDGQGPSVVKIGSLKESPPTLPVSTAPLRQKAEPEDPQPAASLDSQSVEKAHQPTCGPLVEQLTNEQIQQANEPTNIDDPRIDSARRNPSYVKEALDESPLQASQAQTASVRSELHRPKASRGRSKSAAQGQSTLEERAKTPSIESAADKPVLLLPCAEVEIIESAQKLFSRLEKTTRYFVRDRVVFEAVAQPEGGKVLVECTPEAFCSQIEGWFTLLKSVNSSHSKIAWMPSRCSIDTAKKLLASDAARDLLPPVEIVTSAPIFVEEAGGLIILNKGYYPVLGGILVTKERNIIEIGLKEASRSLLDLLSDFSFVAQSDNSRAIASFISPALRLGHLIKGDCPLDIAEADASQSGKTYRQKVACALYGETPYVINVSEERGVGSLDEKISDALLSGRPFLMMENVRGEIRSTLLESALRGLGIVQARRAYSRNVEVKTDQICFFLSSNRFTATTDLAKRSVITRIRKQPDGYEFKRYREGDLLDHVLAQADYYLSCIFTILRHWHREGRKRSEDNRHDFREWSQTLDWIVQAVFSLPPLLDGHQGEQERIAHSDLGWLRQIALFVDKADRLETGLQAHELVEFCEEAGLRIPGCHDSTTPERCLLAIGKTLKSIFANSDSVELSGYKIRRESTEEYNPINRTTRVVHTYFFTRCN